MANYDMKSKWQDEKGAPSIETLETRFDKKKNSDHSRNTLNGSNMQELGMGSETEILPKAVDADEEHTIDQFMGTQEADELSFVSTQASRGKCMAPLYRVRRLKQNISRDELSFVYDAFTKSRPQVVCDYPVWIGDIETAKRSQACGGGGYSADGKSWRKACVDYMMKVDNVAKTLAEANFGDVKVAFQLFDKCLQVQMDSNEENRCQFPWMFEDGEEMSAKDN